MTDREFLLFVSALRTYYPRENILPNKQAVELWYKQLEDIPYNVAEVVLNKWVSLNKWSPSIADIREQAYKLTTGDTKEWGEAWQEVIKSMGIYGSYRITEAMDSFDEITRKTVEQMGYKNLCLSENQTADRANFRTIYEKIAEESRKEASLPTKLKEIINNMPEMIEKGGKE